MKQREIPMVKINVQQRGEVWYLQYPDPKTGQRRFRSLETTDEEEANDLCARYRLDSKTRQQGGVPEYPLIDALRKWKDEHLPTLAKPLGYKSHFKKILEFIDGKDYLLSEVVEIAENMQEVWGNQGLAQSTINQRLSILKKTATLAHKKWKPQWLSKPLSQLIELPNPDNIREVLLSEDQIYQLIDVITNPEIKAYTLFMAFTGMRKAEARRIHPDHMRKISGGYELTIRGKCGLRTIPLEPDQAEFVRQYTPIIHSENYYYKPFQRAVKALGWSDGGGVKMHDLRHFCATWMLSNRTDHKIIMQWLGHTTTVMLDRYLKLTSCMLRNATPTRAMDKKPKDSHLKVVK